MSNTISTKYLSQDEEIHLFKQYKENNCLKSVETLILSQLGYISKMAWQYKNYNATKEDLEQEGVIGLMRAIANYDLSRKVRLISYAIPYIKNAMLEYVMRHIGIVKKITTKPHRNLFFNLNKMRDDNLKLTQNEIKAISKKLSVSEYEVIDMDLRLSNKDFSVDMPVFDDDDISNNYIDTLIGEQENSYITTRENTELNDEREGKLRLINEAIESLSEREKYIFLSRNLIENPTTMHELGKELAISSSRVGQIEIAAMKKIKEYVLNRLTN